MSDFKEQCEEYRKSIGDSHLYILDVNGVKIRAGDKVQTIQFPGGLLPPAKSFIGIAIECKDAFGITTIGLINNKGKLTRLIYGHINKVL
jgi:hypothetical protein